MKKIIIISNISWTISNFRLDLVKLLISNNYQVTCIADEDTFNKDSISQLKDVGADFIKLKISRKGLNPLTDLKYSINLYKILHKERPDLIINYTIKPIIYSSIISRILGIKSMSVISGLGNIFIKNNLLSFFTKFLYAFSLQFPSKIYFLNQVDMSYFIDNKIVNENKTFLLNGEGINTSYYSPLRKIDNDKFIFLKICRLIWEKGVGQYIEAAKILKVKFKENVEFQLIGFFDNDNPGSISKKEIEKLESEGYIHYMKDVKDVRPFLQNCDCFVLASFYREGIPRSLLEAASMEKPIITTDSVGCRDTVENGVTGYLCQPQDVVDLVEKMEIIYNSTSEERQKMGRNGRKRMISFFDEKIINQVYLKDIELILSNN
ncbi:MAG: glycosyltransferase family 4 protein [Bacteroidia bacterium]|nr:glycosyltransferase family 4 protein [Bacteroidia bacterium]